MKYDVIAGGISPGEKRSRQDYATQINQAYCQGLEAVLEMGRLLIQAKDELAGEFFAMVASDLPFSTRTADRLMAIAKHSALSNETHVSHLPPAWGTLYELSRLPPETIEQKIADGTINPEMERKQAVALVNPSKAAAKPSGARLLAVNKDLRAQIADKDSHIEELEAARHEPTLEEARHDHALLTALIDDDGARYAEFGEFKRLVAALRADIEQDAEEKNGSSDEQDIDRRAEEEMDSSEPEQKDAEAIEPKLVDPGQGQPADADPEPVYQRADPVEPDQIDPSNLSIPSFLRRTV
jgi:hypothetical protein